MDCSLPGSSVHGIFQAGVLEWASLVAQRLKRLPAMWETQVRSLGWEDPLEKEMATHFQYSCLENPMDGEACRLQSMVGYSLWGRKESDMPE